MERPEIKMPLPGPNAKRVVEKDKMYISPSYTRDYPAVIEKGDGVWLWDIDGNKFLDLAAGIAVNSTGHVHPKVRDAIIEQAKKLIHVGGTDFYYEIQVKLAKRLAEIVPVAGERKKVFFGNSGTEAVEGAIKLARHKTRRPIIIGFLGAFHGRTMGTLALTASKAIQRRYFAPMMPQAVHIPYPDPYRTPFGVPKEKVTDVVIEYLDRVFHTVAPPEDVAAVVVEPIQGEGGYIVPPKDFFPRLKEMLEKYGILLITDEVQSGVARTGKWYAIEHWGVKPDILTTAKGIASGMPISAFVASDEIMDWPPGAHGNTFGGNPISSAAALATLEVLEPLLPQISEVGDYTMKRLRELQEKYEEIGDVRGIGLMIGIDFVKDRETKEYYTEFRDAVLHEAFHRGLIMLPCGYSVIRVSPPLIITKEHIDVAIEILDGSIKAAREKIAKSK